jgi:hypothetical protein
MVEHFLLGIFSFILICLRVNIIGIDLVGLLCGSYAGTIGLHNQPTNLSRRGVKFDKGFMILAFKRAAYVKHTINKSVTTVTKKFGKENHQLIE